MAADPSVVLSPPSVISPPPPRPPPWFRSLGQRSDHRPSIRPIHGARKRCYNRRPIKHALGAAAEVFWSAPVWSAPHRKGLDGTIIGTHGHVARGTHRGGGGGGGALRRRLQIIGDACGHCSQA